MTTILESEIQSVYLPSFIASTKAIFKTMLGLEITVQAFDKAETFQPGHDVSGIIGLAGAIEGTIVVSLDKEVAFAAAETFIGERPDSINGDILDLVGELANMIGGGAKDRLNTPGVILGLPTTVSGNDYRISFKPDVEIETVQFKSPSGSFTIQIAMRKPA
ncbi:MAG: chemotaxis protein CheX [Planctomycetota bacterium]|nr:chemotaxis protein CheX [Planctomycetota bacterium]